MKRIAIVDTVGSISQLAPSYKSHFPFVAEWKGKNLTGDRRKPHPHGSMCAEKALQPLWDSTEPVVVYFLQIFDSQGGFATDDTEILSQLEAWAKEDPSGLYVNNSWGMYVGTDRGSASAKHQAQLWKDFIRSTEAVVTWAAGNDGDYLPGEDNDMPQSLLTGVSSKIGSMSARGVPSSFSGDSKLGRPLCVYWAEDVKLYNGVSGKIEIGSGTSFAAPDHTGLMCALGYDFKGSVEFCRLAAAGPDKARKKPHPKFGFGSMQGVLRKKVEASPYLLNGIRARGIKESPAVWFDMKNMSQERLTLEDAR